MKAIVVTQYGAPEVLQIKALAKPTPKPTEILVRVHATSTNYGDLLARNFRAVTPKTFNMPLPFLFFAKLYFGLRKPNVTILGSEFSGIVESTGAQVTNFKPGEAVFGYLGQGMGAYAEYLCLPASGCVALKPANMTFAEAAATPYGAVMALSLLRQANLQPGQKVLIIGASGGIGSAAVQIARHLGAEVTGVCGTPRLEYVRSLGARQVIDYTQQDFTQTGETYDLIFDVLGRSSFSKCKQSLNPHGRYLRVSFKIRQVLEMLWTRWFSAKKVICAFGSESAADLRTVAELIEAGKLRTLIDRQFPMEQAAAAHRYVEAGQKKANVVITLAGA